MLARRALGILTGLLARAWLSSLRLTLHVHPSLTAGPRRPRALALWHGHQFALLRWVRTQRVAALVSRSADGELLASALQRLGLFVERGSSSRGGVAGLKAIVRRLRQGLDAAFAVDGPRGPRGVVRSEKGSVGAALAARLVGGVVVPMAAACARCHVFARSWDCFELPLPFSRVAVVLGSPLEPDEVSPERLAAAIDEARAEAERILAPHA